MPREHARILGLLAVLLLTEFAPGAAGADDEARRTREVKAAFILNIARFVDWPAGAFSEHAREIHLCLYRSDPLGEAIDTIRARRIRGRSLTVRVVQTVTDPPACNILFVPWEELPRFETDPGAGIPRQPLLTITDATDRQGTVPPIRNMLITLTREERRIGFQIDRRTLRRSGLHLSSELLKLGRILDHEP